MLQDIMPENNHITLHGLGFAARIGVPDAERAAPQRLAADVTLWPAQSLAGLEDDLARTVDYSAAATGSSRRWPTCCAAICCRLFP